jgi:hypothetical protein
MSNPAAENAGIVAGKIATYAGGGSAVIFGLTLNEVGVLVGMFVGLAGLGLSQYWSWKKDRREMRESEKRMKSEFGSSWDKL